MSDENVSVRVPFTHWMNLVNQVAELKEALRFWVTRADRFEEVLPPELGFMKAQGVLNESYAVGRAALVEKGGDGETNADTADDGEQVR